jgi:hypothetical protein
MSFTNQLVSLQTLDGWHVTITDHVDYTSEDHKIYRIPIGAESDGASIPREFWGVIAPVGTHWRAALLHDSAYRNTLQVFDWQTNSFKVANLSKDECDNLLKEAMITLGVDYFTLTTIYEAVQKAGGPSYKKDRS